MSNWSSWLLCIPNQMIYRNRWDSYDIFMDRKELTGLSLDLAFITSRHRGHILWDVPHNPVPDVLAVHRNYYQIVSVNTTLGVGFFWYRCRVFTSGDNCLISIPGSRRSDYQRIDESVTCDLIFLFFVHSCQLGHPCSGRTAVGWGSQSARCP